MSLFENHIETIADAVFMLFTYLASVDVLWWRIESIILLFRFVCIHRLIVIFIKTARGTKTCWFYFRILFFYFSYLLIIFAKKFGASSTNILRRHLFNLGPFLKNAVSPWSLITHKHSFRSLLKRISSINFFTFIPFERFLISWGKSTILWLLRSMTQTFNWVSVKSKIRIYTKIWLWNILSLLSNRRPWLRSWAYHRFNI